MWINWRLQTNVCPLFRSIWATIYCHIHPSPVVTEWVVSRFPSAASVMQILLPSAFESPPRHTWEPRFIPLTLSKEQVLLLFWGYVPNIQHICNTCIYMMLSIHPCVVLLLHLSTYFFALRTKPTPHLRTYVGWFWDPQNFGKNTLKTAKAPCKSQCCFSSSGASSLGWSSKRVFTSAAWPVLSRWLVTSARRSGFQIRKCTSPPRGLEKAM